MQISRTLIIFFYFSRYLLLIIIIYLGIDYRLVLIPRLWVRSAIELWTGRASHRPGRADTFKIFAGPGRTSERAGPESSTLTLTLNLTLNLTLTHRGEISGGEKTGGKSPGGNHRGEITGGKSPGGKLPGGKSPVPIKKLCIINCEFFIIVQFS